MQMQQAPVRLSQTIWSAFRAAKPVHRPRSLEHPNRFSSWAQAPTRRWDGPQGRIAVQARFYSDKDSEVEKKIDDAKNRINDTFEARAEAAAPAGPSLKNPDDETIVHTLPESASIVYNSKREQRLPPESGSPSQPQPQAHSRESPSTKPLPSSLAVQYNQLQARFAHFMDNFQTHIFTASRRLNDLTGYSGIEALKNDIEVQEKLVQQCREAVKSSREQYTEAIAKRSTTQREVNDLLHRKHTWSPTDLERFTSLYRSDHANEQTEAVAQKSVGDAEQQYEEASTKLAKAILARYHEEQIWSDKIRQMSTWGTWGLMGINVLLFVIFQIVLEPWRRRRLVKGFEEKVELAIKEGQLDARAAGMMAAPTASVQPNQGSAPAVTDLTTGEKVSAVADNLAGQIVDAITGTAMNNRATSPVPSQTAIEEAVEIVTTGEIAVDEGLLPGSPGVPFKPTLPEDHASPPSNANGSLRWTSPSSSLAGYEDYIRALFSEDHKILVSQRDLTTVAMEGVAGGMAIMGLLFVLLRPR